MVQDQFKIVVVPPDAREATEQMGTKEKFWFQNDHFLFKFNRPGHGEDWAERIATELASVLRIPHAEVELATFNAQPGVVSTNFVTDGGALFHGNELMVQLYDPSYPKEMKQYVPQHTVKGALNVLGNPGFHLPKTEELP